MNTQTLPTGYQIRPAEKANLEAVVDLFNVYWLEQVGKPQFSVEEMEAEWESPHFNLASDTQVVLNPDGQLVGYAEVWDKKPHVKLWSFVRVHPTFRGRGVGTVLAQWVEARARQAIAKAPAGARISVMQILINTDELSEKLLREQGYELVRHSVRMRIVMDQAPPAPAVPAGVTIRPYIAGQEERAVALAFQDSFRDHWGHVERPFEEEFQDWMHWVEHDPTYDPALWFVAEDHGEIAGLCLGTPQTSEDPAMGYVNILGVRRPWRRRGVGLALLLHIFGAFYHRGTRKVGLGVDAQSLTGATRLYEKAGMQVYRQFNDFEKELRPGVDLSTQVADA